MSFNSFLRYSQTRISRTKFTAGATPVIPFLFLVLVSSISTQLLWSTNSEAEFRMAGSVSRDQRTISLRLTSDRNQSGCPIAIFGGFSASELERSASRNDWLSYVDGTPGRAPFRSLPLSRLSRRDGGTLLLQGRSRCAGRNIRTNTAAVRIIGTTGGVARSAFISELRQKLLPQDVELQQVFSNISFDSPLDLQSAPDRSDRLFVVEQEGIIAVITNASTAPARKTFLDIRSRVTSGGERGLLGLTFHPRYTSNGYFFVNYTAGNDGHTVIARFKVTGDADVADPNSELQLLTVNQPFSNHNGGALDFGPDGRLYIALGDGGSGGDPSGNAQNTASLLGKILRIDVDSTSAGRNYAIPRDNPYATGNGGMPEIFALGLRNPWRMSFDSRTGKLWAGDVGQSAREEVDIIVRGRNYGWNVREGNICYNPPSGCSSSGFSRPLADYPRSVGQSITGGYVYRGSRLPQLSGTYVFGDFVSGVVLLIQHDGRKTVMRQFQDTDLNVASFGVDNRGELYLLDLSGKIFRFQ